MASNSESTSRAIALTLFNAGLRAADPVLAVRNTLQTDQSLIFSQSSSDVTLSAVTDSNCKRVVIIAVGKAACAMAEAAYDSITELRHIENGLIVTNYENQKTVKGFDVIGAGHPVPDSNGLHAAGVITARLKGLQADDLLIALISGGGSALLPLPHENLRLEDKISTTTQLLQCGAAIDDINCVRKHLSAIKGGHMTRLASPAAVHTLMISDVIGDDPGTIASGPTVPDNTTYEDALNSIHRYGIARRIPKAVVKHLQDGIRGIIAETPKPGDPCFERSRHIVICSNSVSVKAMQNAASQSGLRTEIYSTRLTGEAREQAQKLMHYAEQKIESIYQPLAIIAGGETTVTIRGNGKGGRNQEFCLAFAIAAEQSQTLKQWTLLSAGTDGRDGPTDAAGGIVDDQTVTRIRAQAGNPAEFLEVNDAYHALQAAGDLLITGPTGTNVADVLILLLFPE